MGRLWKVVQSLVQLAKAVHANCVYTEKRWEYGERKLEATVKKALEAEGIELKCYNASLLQPANQGTKTDGSPFLVFTPYWKSSVRQFETALRPILPMPLSMPTGDITLPHTPIESLELMPRIHWYQHMQSEWNLSEAGGQALLDAFLNKAILNYKDDRNIPSIQGTSKMSPYFHFGVMSVSDVFKQALDLRDTGLGAGAEASIQHFHSELGWREFAHHLLYYHPTMPREPLRESFKDFPWEMNEAFLTAWQKGQTGYPLVDAGMRELWATGWMHNRVRMVVGSLLVKHLLIPWQKGENWFWDTLIDADLANNSMGWQWISGCGADASPYFRVFNPIMQSQKFDADGHYIRRWVPELAKVPSSLIHNPWEADAYELKQYGVIMGQTYPLPIVDHAKGRHRALDALSSIKQSENLST
jgi:deoxyribodipyrimidine photo-lyase